MRITLKGRHVEITDDIRDYALAKLRKLERKHADPTSELEVELHLERSDHVAAATLHAKGRTLRAKEKGSGFKEALDLLSANLERQVQRYRDKRNPRERAHIAKRHEPSEPIARPSD